MYNALFFLIGRHTIKKKSTKFLKMIDFKDSFKYKLLNNIFKAIFLKAIDHYNYI